MTKLMTPPIASLPYTADALSFSTSTFSRAASGMLFTSTVVLSVKVPPPDTRLPLISTRVRCDPSPRSETPETPPVVAPAPEAATTRSEEHTSELQSRLHLACRLLLAKKTHRTPVATAAGHRTRHLVFDAGLDAHAELAALAARALQRSGAARPPCHLLQPPPPAVPGL